MAVRSTQGQNRAVRSTQGGGVSPIRGVIAKINKSPVSQFILTSVTCTVLLLVLIQLSKKGHDTTANKVNKLKIR